MVNLLSRISLGDRLDDVSLLDSVADKMNQNVMSRSKSITIIEEQHLINDDKGREIHSVPDEITCSKWVGKSRREAAISDNCQGGFTRSRKLTVKGFFHKKKTLRERRRKIDSRLIRKYGAIEDLLRSSTNKVAVEEEMSQFNDVLKMLIYIHQDYNHLLDDDERGKHDHWFDEIDTQECASKRKVHWRLREAAQKINSAKSSSRSSKSFSNKGSGNSRVSKSSQRSQSSKDTKLSKEKR